MKRASALALFALAASGAWAIQPSGAATKTKVLCFNNNHPTQGPPDVRSSPRKCSLYRRGYDYEAAGAVHMRKLRWKHWGGPTAVANGQYAQPMDIDDPWKPIRVRLKQPAERCGRTVYTRAVFHSEGYHIGFPIWVCP
jgi:hypothetical protein